MKENGDINLAFASTLYMRTPQFAYVVTAGLNISSFFFVGLAEFMCRYECRLPIH